MTTEKQYKILREESLSKREKLIVYIGHLLDKVWFRVLASVLIAYFGILTVKVLNQHIKNQAICLPGNLLSQCLYQQVLDVVDVGNVEGFSILAAASLYILESRERRRHHIYEAWQVIDNAAAAKVPTSHARFKALKVLNTYGESFEGLDVPGADLKNIELERADLRNANLSGTDLTGANLSYANLSGADLRRTNFSNANLDGANLNSVHIRDAVYTEQTKFPEDFNLDDRKMFLISPGAKLSNADLSGIHLSDSSINDADFSNADLSGAILKDVNLSGANLSNANLSGANFSGANLRGANLSNANLRDADFTDTDLGGNANLKGANLKNANLKGTNFIGSKLNVTNLSGANLKATNLDAADCSGAIYTNKTKFPKNFVAADQQMYLVDSNTILKDADLSNRDLRGVNLSNASLESANFSNTDLTNVDLSNANLKSANFQGANLSGVNLGETNLKNADFSGANLENANLKNANLKGANLIDTKNLTKKQIELAKNWQIAKYSQDFSTELGLLSIPDSER
jgi:uncharacterized protein YjbI with pentapeptide repeats